jgi:anti-sigma factor RsiW
MTTCTSIQPHLSDYVDGTLAPETRDRVAAHVASCEACRATVRDFERLRDAARGLGAITPPPHVWQQIATSLPSGQAQPLRARHRAGRAGGDECGGRKQRGRDGHRRNS